MPSTASSSLRLQKMANGEKLNTWGDELNDTVFELIEDAIAGHQSLTITGDVTLTSINYATDQARMAVLCLTGAPGAAFEVVIPSVTKWYWVKNETSSNATVTAGGTGVVVYPGELVSVICDGTDCSKLNANRLQEALNAGGFVIENLAAPTENDHATNKSYVDAAVLDLSGGNLPGQGAGTRGAAIVSDGSSANWVQQIAGQRITSTQTLVANGQPYYCDVSGGAFTVTLPASPTEEDYVVIDVSSDAASNNLTVARNSETIEGDASDFTVDLGPRRYVFVYLNSDWKVV